VKLEELKKVKDNINELETNSKNKNISAMYTSINKFKKC
jgi:hypothetical protein